jgi:integrase
MKLPKFVHGYTDRLGKPRFYYRRKGANSAPLPDLPWSPAFMQAYEAAEAAIGTQPPPGPIGASRTLPGSLNAALVKYYQSSAFTEGLAKSTQGPRRALLERFRKERGDRPLRELQHRHVQAIISKLTSPAVQRNMLRALRHFLKFALSEGLIDNDPSAGVRRGKMPNTGGFRPWTEENVTTYVARHPIGTQAYLAMQLMLCLSVRKSDAVQIGPRHIHKTREHPLGVLDNYQPQKGRRTGGNYVTVPLHEDLAAAIAAAPVIGSDTYLVTSFGKPFTANGFGNKMREWCNEAGLPECASHGLRKLCLTRLAEAGCTAFEIASISGHKEAGGKRDQQAQGSPESERAVAN